MKDIKWIDRPLVRITTDKYHTVKYGELMFFIDWHGRCKSGTAILFNLQGYTRYVMASNFEWQNFWDWHDAVD